MIYVTQGHEKGIGLEVFFKSICFLRQVQLNNIKLYCYREDVQSTLNTLPHHSKINEDSILFSGKIINVSFVSKQGLHSTETLLAALKDIKSDDVLFTLPTSKDQLVYKDNSALGYTEFLRSYFNNSSIAMTFKSQSFITALLSDHLPLKNVSSILSTDYILEKSTIVLNNIVDSFHQPDEVLFTGINPHSGENGKLGTEEQSLALAIDKLKSKLPNINILDQIIPADTIHFHLKPSIKQLVFYAYHDQALTVYKHRFGLFGANITLGLPFLRLSVDHGTAFSLYGKNSADSSGCLYCLKEALKWSN